MCKRHWFMVPKPLRDGLWDAYRPGQERRMDPSPKYLLAAARCVHAVAVKEGQPPDEIAFEVGMYEAWHDMVADQPARLHGSPLRQEGPGMSDDYVQPEEVRDLLDVVRWMFSQEHGRGLLG